MDGFTYFLAYSRLAPVQAVTHGHPCTTGIPTIDYFVSFKSYEPEENQKFYTEKLVRLEGQSSPYFIPDEPVSSEQFRIVSYFSFLTEFICRVDHQPALKL